MPSNRAINTDGGGSSSCGATTGISKSPNAGATSSHVSSIVDELCSYSREPSASRWTSARSRFPSPSSSSGSALSSSSSFGWWFWPRQSPPSHVVGDLERLDGGVTSSMSSVSSAILASTSCRAATRHHQRRLWMARSLSMLSMAACVTLVVISVAHPPDWKTVVGTTGNGSRYVDDGVVKRSGGGDGGGAESSGGGAEDRRRRSTAETPGRDSGGAILAGGGGGGGGGGSITNGLLAPPPSTCSEPLYGGPPPLLDGGSSYPHPYLRPVPDPEMAEYKFRVEAYLASPAFRQRVQRLKSLGSDSGVVGIFGRGEEGSNNKRRADDSPGGAASCEGCALEGILISAGGPRLLTNLLVLLRVLRFHLNSTLPVEISWAGPREMPGQVREPSQPDEQVQPPPSPSGGADGGDSGSKNDGKAGLFRADIDIVSEVAGGEIWAAANVDERKKGSDAAAGNRESKQQQQRKQREAKPPAGEAFIQALRDAGLGPVYGMDLSLMPYPEHHRRPPELTHWGAKVYSLLACTRFRRVLLLDADNLPLADPRVTMFDLLHPASGPVSAEGEGSAGSGRGSVGTIRTDTGKPLAVSGRGGGSISSSGVLIWSDAWRGWAGPEAYREVGLDPDAAALALNHAVMVSTTGGVGDSVRDSGVAGGGWRGRWGRRDAESGAVLIDRAAHADVLEYLWWINSFGNRLYHRLLHGDKDTFALAFAAAGKANCYSQVATPPGAVFRWGRRVLEFKTPPTSPATDAPSPSGSMSSQPPPPGDGWQLVGFTQYHPATGQPLILHRTMNKWPALKRSAPLPALPPPHPKQVLMQPPGGAETQSLHQAPRHHQGESEPPGSWEGWLQAAERGWPIQVLTGPLPAWWCEYYLAHDSLGPTKGMWWEHVVPEAALQLVLHPAYGAAAERTADPPLMAAGTGFPTNVTRPPQLCDNPQRYVELLQGAIMGLPTANSATAEVLHAACGPLLRATMEHAVGHAHTASAAAAAAAARGLSYSSGGYGATTASPPSKGTSAAIRGTGTTPSGNASFSIGGMRHRNRRESSGWRVQPVQHRKWSLTPPFSNAPRAAVSGAAATGIMSAPWSVRDRCLALALAEALLSPSSPPPPPPLPKHRQHRQQLPSWPSLYAALFRACLAELHLEQPYTAKSPPQPSPSQQQLRQQLQPSAESSVLTPTNVDPGDSFLKMSQLRDFGSARGNGAALESLAEPQPAPPSVPGWPLQPPPPLPGLAVCVEAPRRGTRREQRMGSGAIQSPPLACRGSAQRAPPPSLPERDMEADRCNSGPTRNNGSSSSSSMSTNEPRSAHSGEEREPRSWWRLAVGKGEEFPSWGWSGGAVGTKRGADAAGRAAEGDFGGSSDGRSTGREMCDPWVLSVAAADDLMLGPITAAYREHECVLAAVARGDWPQLLDG